MKRGGFHFLDMCDEWRGTWYTTGMVSVNTKFIVAVVGVLLIITALWVLVLSPDRPATQAEYTLNRPERGNPAATVTVTEYADFSCPDCRALLPTMDDLANRYSDRVRFQFRYLPISPEMVPAAVAAECAQAQGKFWDYARLLFAGTVGGAPTTAQLLTWGRSLGFDAAFEKCVTSQTTKPIVEYDIQQGFAVGFTSVPAVLVNGQLVNTATLESTIVRALAATQ